MSTNFAKTLVWKHDYDAKLWRHKQRTPNTNDHHMTLNETPMKNFCVRHCSSSTRKQFDAGERARKGLMWDIKLRKPVAAFALPLNSINDFKVRWFQIQTHFRCEFRCVLLWRPLWIEMKLTFCACLEGVKTVVEVFAVFFQTVDRFLIF